MSENGLPCIDLLEATPTILRGLMAEVDHDAVSVDVQEDVARVEKLLQK